MSTSKNTSAMQFAKSVQAKKTVRIKDGKKGHYRSEALGCSYSRKMAMDPLRILLNS